MSLSSDYQKLEPGNVVRLSDVNGTAFDVSDVLRSHAHDIAHTADEIAATSGDENKLPAKSIWWQGHEYKAWSCQIKGIETTTDGASVQPALSAANLDSFIMVPCLTYDDLLQAKVTIYGTLTQYPDAKNYPEDNLSANPQQKKLRVFYIDAKSTETNKVVAFTLSSPMDLQGLTTPIRQLHPSCIWCIRNKYRSGDGCDYTGTCYFDKHNNPANDPSLDEYPGTFTVCKLRHGEGSELPFGDFPDTSLIRNWYAPEDYRRHHGACCC